jgi:hypothetical protein
MVKAAWLDERAYCVAGCVLQLLAWKSMSGPLYECSPTISKLIHCISSVAKTILCEAHVRSIVSKDAVAYMDSEPPSCNP